MKPQGRQQNQRAQANALFISRSVRHLTFAALIYRSWPQCLLTYWVLAPTHQWVGRWLCCQQLASRRCNRLTFADVRYWPIADMG
jgi:hypothetical protein